MQRALGSARPAARAGLAIGIFAGLMMSQALAQTPAPKPAPSTPKPAASAPQRTETVVYDNWTVTCHDSLSKDAKRTCAANLRVINNKTQQNLLVWEIGNDATGKPIFALRVPLGVLTRPGIVLTVGAGKPRKFDYVLCDPQGCEAAGPFDNALSKELGAAAEATVTFVATTGQPIALKVPLKGIAEAVPALRD
ncbi:Invasion protein IalB, involved in pathogenesis [Kaistia soli DSM 19436]|uniref:Invasion protein IalB, involved in pathogenesis n=1 Tax=Kaistia soli DSM 19436 TaxID=1122133 RepID=A0A1M5G8T7_9HYPH|nr:invasion associated locus B family protein [Kaistia soli]SHG00167.1 Invasion protein IalB, involved in pathogenesis [Kaistia soli DSM 19436]